jgi:hypothetical protein
MRGITRAIWLLLPVLVDQRVADDRLVGGDARRRRDGDSRARPKVTRASLAEPRDLGFKDDVYLATRS